MDIIITCHTEYGYVKEKTVIPDKNAKEGVVKGVPNLISLADTYNAKVTFAVMPEVVQDFPDDIEHEIGLHVHAGWRKSHNLGVEYFVGDDYLWHHCQQDSDSVVLKDHSYEEQFCLIKKGKELIEETFNVIPRSFIAGKWSINNDTIQALIKLGFTHECSAPAHAKACHHDWSRLPRICMPYHPKNNDYQQRGDLPILIVPISQMFPLGSVSPEIVPIYGLSWLKACFLEYYTQEIPLFHICLHSPCMTDPYYLSVMNKLLKFMSAYDVTFKCAGDLREYKEISPKTKLTPYLLSVNSQIVMTSAKYLLKMARM